MEYIQDELSDGNDDDSTQEEDISGSNNDGVDLPPSDDIILDDDEGVTFAGHIFGMWNLVGCDDVMMLS